ncbi:MULTISPECIES: hypothetical protein [unclassified Streptomyces]|uniref:hypothetical protein n=1 Tax=unclassified Streptomyces TaxID=2593676 RepID=UPI001180296D|nr:hypothetical protein [Streptomyces sp. IB201691-2A2]TRO68602.1 hypothetical protein E4K73_07310 [Streptomyces sp. IB201691-2A2]
MSEHGAAPPTVDAYLEILLRLVDAQPDASLKICLTTPGGIVAGSLVGSRTWADRWETTVSAATGAQDRADHMAHLAHTVRSALKQTEPDTGDGLHSFIHLVDVTFLSVPGTTTAPLWRGRLGDVSGWSLGAPADRPAS